MNEERMNVDLHPVARLWRVSTSDCDSQLGRLWCQKFYRSEQQAKNELLSEIEESNRKHDEHRQYEPHEIKGFEIGFYCPCFNLFIGLDTVNIEANAQGHLPAESE